MDLMDSELTLDILWIYRKRKNCISLLLLDKGFIVYIY